MLNAFQGNTNSSGTSTKAALDAIRDKSGPVVTSAAQDALKELSGSYVVPPVSASESKSENSSNEITNLFGGAAGAAAGAGAPSPSAVPTMIGVAATPPQGREALTPMPTRTRAPSEAPPLPAPPEPVRADATPSPVKSEPSNSTSPGSKSFAEAPSNAGRTDDTEDAVRAALVQSRGNLGIVAFLRTTRGMAIAGGAALLVIIVLVFAFKSGKPADKKHPVAAKKPAKTEVATAEKPTAETPSTDQSAQPGTNGTEHAVATNNGSGDESATAPVTPTTNTPDTTETPATPDTTTPTTPPPPTHPPVTHPTGPKKAGPTIAGKQVVLEYDNQARDAKAAPKNNAAQADQGAISKARQSYAAGNQRLFAGDADGAIRNYKQALTYYPAYVAGYRGLGLAYAQQGDKPAALKALRTYLSSVPSAKDAELIRKRVATLQAK